MTIHTTAPTRRAILGAIGLASAGVALATGATTGAIAAAKPDAAIITVWERVKAAYVEMRRLERLLPEFDDADVPELWDVIDAGEDLIMKATATTPRGAEIQLWTAFRHFECTGRDTDEMIDREDVTGIAATIHERDFIPHTTFAAIQSLHLMEA